MTGTASGRGAYLVLEGPDGCGKSTQAGLLVARLRRAGRQVLHLREPGSTPVGEALRAVLLDPAVELLPLTEALLFTAARAELVARAVAPALQRGDWVVAERCFLSTLAYQCLAGQPALELEFVLDLSRRAHGADLPDAIFLLDAPPAVAAARRTGRRGDRFEARGPAFQEAVRAAFLQLAAQEPTVQVVDASHGAEAVHQELWRRAERCRP